MGAHSGPADWWTENTDEGREHVATKGIVQSGLVLNLDAGVNASYPGSGTAWTDLSGNGNNGTLTNGPVHVPGESFTFDGINDFSDHGDILDMGTDSITIICWAKLLSSATLNDFFISKARAAAQDFRYGLGILAGTNQVRTFFCPVSGTDILGLATTNLSLNTWYMITGIWDRTASMRIYLNDVEEVVTGGDISAYPSTNLQSNNPYRVGAYTASDNVSPRNPIHANIGNVLHYNRVLTDEEIKQNFNATRNRYGI